MRLPDSDASYSERVRYGRYVGRRLRRAKRVAMATDVEAATALVLQRGREWEDAAGPVQDARADRDATDDDLDDCAKESRAILAGRSADAARNAPYTQVFAEGIEYFTAAPLDQQAARYGQLITRFNEFLPANDEVRMKAESVLTAGIAAFRTATEAVEQAVAAESVIAIRLQNAEEAWDTLLTKIYGALLGDVGKAAAERYFPKSRRAKKNKVEG